MAKKKPVQYSSMFTEVKEQKLIPVFEFKDYSAEVIKLVMLCENYRGKFAEPFRINSHMIINNFDKFLNSQIHILNAYPEDHFLVQSSIVRLIFFKNYINNNHA